MRAALVFLLIAATSCAERASSPAGDLRFKNEPPVWVVNDRKDVPRRPRKRTFLREMYHFDGFWYRRLDRKMEMRAPQRAANVSSLDEVPDSTWFTNRIGVRDLTPAEIAVGPNRTGSPQDQLPFTIQSSKVGGIATGFIVTDRRGIKYVLKFEEKGIPELETAANVVVQRLLWAVGYNVPEDYIIQLRADQLLIDPQAVIEEPTGEKRRLTAADVERALEKVDADQAGMMRALASQFLPGEPIGGHAREGVREDDPNDRVPHELRRELRGAYPIFAWLDHSDIKEDNTVDVYVEDPERPDVHYVVHYLVDFGKALGAQPYMNCLRVGPGPRDSMASGARSLISLGILQPTSIRCRTLEVPSVALVADDFQPGRWRPNTLSYFPILEHDRFDGFWGAKIVMRFTRAHLEAAVGEARYSDPRAPGMVVDRLVRRQRATARYWFDRVDPLDRFEVLDRGQSWRLCFEDLAIAYRLVGVEGSRYRTRVFDFAGEATGQARRVAAAGGGRICIDRLVPAAGADSYTIVELVTERGERSFPGVLVHLARAPGNGAPRVIGIRRR
jgi:hypothetical protein